MRSTGGMWGSVGTYTWRGDTCHVAHDTCHESSDRSDEWVDIDSGKRSVFFSFLTLTPRKKLLGSEYNVMSR